VVLIHEEALEGAIAAARSVSDGEHSGFSHKEPKMADLTAEEEAFYQRIKERLLKDLPPAPTPWWQDADKLIKVIGAIGILAGVIFTGIQSWNNATKIEKNHAENTANHAVTVGKLEDAKTAATEAKTEAASAKAATADHAKKLETKLDAMAPAPRTGPK
jgi:hypothetical protein